MTLLTLPTLCLIIAPFGSGKTTLLKYLLLEQLQNIAGVVVISATGIDSYSTNYSFLNKKYIYDSWSDDFISRICKLGKKIKKHDPSKHLVLIFDDSIGIAKGLFKKEENKKIFTQLRHFNISVLISQHQIQNETTTLIRKNAKDVILFCESEVNGLKMLYESFGRSSANLSQFSDFEQKIRGLPKYHFLHWNRDTKIFVEGSAPSDLPNFRIVLHPEDLKEKEKMLLYGNREGYNLSLIEKNEEEVEEISDDDHELFRETKDANNEEDSLDEGEDIGSEEETECEELEEDLEEFDQKSKKRPREDSPIKIKGKDSSKTKKRKQKELDEEEMENLLDQDPPEHEPELTKKELIVRARIISQLDYANGCPILKQRIDKVFPNFFDRDFQKLKLQELKQLYRQMYSSFQVSDAISSVQNMYQFISLLLKFTCKNGLGYDGPALNFVDNMFEDQVALSTLRSLGKINPYEKYTPSTLDKILQIGVPSAKLLYSAKTAMDTKNLVQGVVEENLSNESVQMYENFLQNK